MSGAGFLSSLDRRKQCKENARQACSAKAEVHFFCVAGCATATARISLEHFEKIQRPGFTAYPLFQPGASIGLAKFPETVDGKIRSQYRETRLGIRDSETQEDA